jgi:uncharacterized membrane-anchored protein
MLCNSGWMSASFKHTPSGTTHLSLKRQNTADIDMCVLRIRKPGAILVYLNLANQKTDNMTNPAAIYLPEDDSNRYLVHYEVHARPNAIIKLPAMVVYVAVINDGVTREMEYQHLNRLPGHGTLSAAQLQANFLRLELGDNSLTWERHTEFTSYSFVQPLSGNLVLDHVTPQIFNEIKLDQHWVASLPGKTLAAIKLALLPGDISNPDQSLKAVRAMLGRQFVVASLMGNNRHSIAVADFMLRNDGFEHMLVIAPADTTATRAGRISQRLLELETYRLMALQALPVAKHLSPLLSEADGNLADITKQLENKGRSDQQLLDTLISMAAMVERATTQHIYRFSATRAYYAIVNQRIAELRESPIAGTQTIGEFMQRRLSPAIATVVSTSDRLESLSERISRVSALLRTRVDIATEVQNQQLLEKLTRGQELQLRLQATVEGLSIAAISYYVVSLLSYLTKAAKSAGLPIHVEMTTGVMIPLVVWAVWRTTREVHKKLIDKV